MINPVAEKLKIPLHRIYANNLLFKSDGSFAGHDDKELTCRDGGKPAVVQKLKDTHGYKTIIMIGDGATDMQARPPADAFIGFGGVVARAPVKEGADWFVTDFNDVIQVLTTSPKKTTK
jgi:phosphoserine phosphatase